MRNIDEIENKCYSKIGNNICRGEHCSSALQRTCCSRSRGDFNRPQTPENCLNNKSNQAGITLIALIITIIILLILASITISLTLGERGIFNTAKRAVENYKEAEEKEFAELSNFEQEMNNTINGIGNSSVTVKQPVTSIKIEPENIEIKTGEKVTITAKVEPENATNKTIEFISGNTDVITVGEQKVNEDGTISVEITAVGEGNTTITAKSIYGENGKEVTGASTIKVYKPIVNIPVTSSTWNVHGRAWDSSFNFISGYDSTINWYDSSVFIKSNVNYSASDARATTASKYNLNNYNKIIMTIDSVNLVTGIGIGILEDSDWFKKAGEPNYIKNNLITSGSPKQLELDISKIQGEYYIQGYVFGNGNAMRITEVRLESK